MCKCHKERLKSENGDKDCGVPLGSLPSCMAPAEKFLETGVFLVKAYGLNPTRFSKHFDVLPCIRMLAELRMRNTHIEGSYSSTVLAHHLRL